MHSLLPKLLLERRISDIRGMVHFFTEMRCKERALINQVQNLQFQTKQKKQLLTKCLKSWLTSGQCSLPIPFILGFDIPAVEETVPCTTKRGHDQSFPSFLFEKNFRGWGDLSYFCSVSCFNMIRKKWISVSISWNFPTGNTGTCHSAPLRTFMRQLQLQQTRLLDRPMQHPLEVCLI